ncbi:MAG: TonB-dependent receptor [Verrucomicrobia bacterium]|nr:TonB-dependent receptor [Verrucomicrobiota bacterium]
MIEISKIRTWGYLLLALTVLVNGVFAQESATVRGTVVETVSNLNLEGATVRLAELDLRTTTDRSGRFVFRGLPAGEYTISAQFPGQPPATLRVRLGAGEETSVRLALGGDDVIDLGEFVVTSGPTATERAMARQRAQQNIADIVSADALGNFPDKTLADAVRRLAGITIERGPGQGEARYVTVRGLNSDFNSVSLDGVPVTVSNFDGASRSVPLDVISTRTADSIEVTKTLRPSDNADSIGGLITIRSRSAFDRDGRFLSAQAGGYYNRLIDRYGSGFYLSAWGYDGSFGYSDFLNEDRTVGLSLSVTTRAVPFASQSVDTRGFTTVINSRNHPMGEAYEGLLVPTGVVLQEFFDKVDNLGVNTVLDFRPSDDAEYQLVLNWSNRESRRGRQRQEIRFDRDFRFWNRSAAIEVEGDTITEFTSDNRVMRQIRDFYEDQNHYTARLQSKHTFGDLQLNLLAGFQRGEFDGDPNRDIAVLFRSGFGDNTYRLDGSDLYFPRVGTEVNRLDPAQFGVNQIDLGTRFITDDEWIVGTDLKWEMDGGRTFSAVWGASIVFARGIM